MGGRCLSSPRRPDVRFGFFGGGGGVVGIDDEVVGVAADHLGG